jgi:putative hemolysin
MPVKFVPEVARVLSALQVMRDDRVGEAVVVDEWGGMAGIVSLEDIFEELVGELRVEGEDLEKPVVPIGEGRFRVSGGLSIRDWNEAFGARLVPTEFETLAGFVTAMLGRIPKRGDEIELEGGLHIIVHEVRGRRVLSVEIFVAKDTADEKSVRAGGGPRGRGL